MASLSSNFANGAGGDEKTLHCIKWLQQSGMSVHRPDERRLGAACQHRGPPQIWLVQTEHDNGTENKPTA